MFTLPFLLVFATTILIIAKVMYDSLKNSKAHIQTVEAKVVDTRAVFHERSIMGGFDYPAGTIYYAVFEVENGDRMEFLISYPEYNCLAIGQVGRLTFQGRRIGSFKQYG